VGLTVQQAVIATYQFARRHYVFKLKAKNIYGFESREAAFRFEIILPGPSAVAYYLYLV
jgi:hypothetical protein